MTYFNRKEKTHNTRPLPKEKNRGPQVHVASPHWLNRILILKFVGHVFVHSNVGVLIGVHSLFLYRGERKHVSKTYKISRMFDLHSTFYLVLFTFS